MIQPMIKTAGLQGLRKMTGILMAVMICLSCLAVASAAEPAVQEARNGVARICSAATVRYWGDHEDICTVTGTGFFVGKNGEPVDTVVTNRHLVSGDSILEQIKQVDKKYEKATLLELKVWLLIDNEAYEVDYARDVTLSQITDLAILKLKHAIDNRVPMVIADPDVDVTDNVYAIGFPSYSDVEDHKNSEAATYEDLILKAYPSAVENMSVTQGYVVKTHVVIGGIDHIQHAAAISSGSSGSPLVKEDGSVVGVNTWVSTEEKDTANFAIDSSNVKTFLRQNNIDYAEPSDMAPETEPESSEEPSPELEPEPAPETSKSNTMLFVIGGVVVVVAVAALIVVSQKKKKERENAERRKQEEQKQLEEEKRKKEEKQKRIEESGKTKPPEIIDYPPTEPIKRRGQKIQFYVLGSGKGMTELKIEEGRVLKLGRDERADLILNHHDDSLSGVHCLVRCEGQSLRVQHASKTNLTYINGVPLRKPPVDDGQIHGSYSVLMREGDVLKAGQYEYRIHFAGNCVL